MGENENQFKELIDQENNLEVEEVLEPGLDCCIYRVPQYLRKINEEAYTPGFISIGPLHYGSTELMGMEKQKTRILSKFRERVGAQKWKELETYIQNQVQRIRDHYSVTSKLQNRKYVTVILRDAVFIVELLAMNNHGSRDFLLGNLQQRRYIQLDLMLIENQIPYFVLNHLYSSAFPSSESPSFIALCYKFFSDGRVLNDPYPEQPQIKHFTDLLRRGVVPIEQQSVDLDDLIGKSAILDLPCATKLYKSGLEFKVDKNGCWSEIRLRKRKSRKWLPWFEVNELQIPCIQISDETECLLRNIMALEIFYYPTKTYVCHYANLMDYLIDTTKDVDLLIEKGIIANHVGDIESIVKMFNRLGSHIALNGSPYFEDVKKMKAQYKQPWNHLKATLKSVYFSNLWTGTATTAAAFLLILTVIQTVCSLMQLRGNSNDNGTTL